MWGVTPILVSHRGSRNERRMKAEVIENNGATRRDRTGDLLITNQPLYQLS